MNHARRFIIWFCVLMGLAAFGYLGLFRMQHGSPVAAEWWVKHVYDYKQNLARSINSPKAILLTGSSALFGFDSALFKHETGMETVNLSVHAGLDMQFFYFQLEEVLGEGDIVVMPLEYEHYVSDPSQTFWFVSNMLAWGNTLYLEKLNWFDYLRFISRVPVSRLWEGLLAGDTGSKQLDGRTVRQEVLEANRSGPPAFQGYSHRSINLNGDILVRSRALQYGRDAVSKIAFKAGDPYIDMSADISKRFQEQYARIQALAKTRGAQVLLAWPVSIRNRQFDFVHKDTQNRFHAFNSKLKNRGIEVHCNPVMFNLHPAFFYDNRYHLNALGGKARTLNLAECVRQYLAKQDTQSFDLEQSLNQRKNQETLLLKRVEKR